MNDIDATDIDSKTDQLDELTLNNSQTRKTYLSPRLEKFGRFRDLTLGMSLGMTDTGSQGEDTMM